MMSVPSVYKACQVINLCPFCSIDSTRIWDNPFLTQVRLTGGDTVNQGLVEVYCYGKWGTVRSVDKFKANIICRQLGYYGAYNTHHLSM